jgi:hypothetical protein
MCIAAITIGIALSPELSFTPSSIVIIPLLGLACAAAEAVSPHGWDNLTMQLVPTFLATFIL